VLVSEVALGSECAGGAVLVTAADGVSAVEEASARAIAKTATATAIAAVAGRTTRPRDASDVGIAAERKLSIVGGRSSGE